jgi:hypothetical protein
MYCYILSLLVLNAYLAQEPSGWFTSPRSSSPHWTEERSSSVPFLYRGLTPSMRHYKVQNALFSDDQFLFTADYWGESDWTSL